MNHVKYVERSQVCVRVLCVERSQVCVRVLCVERSQLCLVLSPNMSL